MGALSRLEKPALDVNNAQQVLQSSSLEDSLRGTSSPLIILIALSNDSVSPKGIEKILGGWI